MKNKENQKVRLSNILGVIFLSLILLILISVPWGTAWNESKVLRARNKAEVLGYQLAQLYQENFKKTLEGPKGLRNIASTDTDMVEFKPEGLMGIDPWGQPYKYSIQQVSPEQLRVTIWSMGPNLKDDTEANDPNKSRFLSRTDDIQIVLNIPVSQ